MTEETENSPYTTFKRRALLSYEDKEALRQLGQHLCNLDPVSAAKSMLWWFQSEAWRFSPLRPWHKYVDRHFDNRYGVDTLTRVQVTELTVVGENAEHGVYYQASPVIDTRRAISALPIKPSEWTFIDVGSGKGRVLLLASEHPFGHVVGLEFGREIHEIAEQNLARYAKRKADSVETRLCDATTFEFPDANLVVYFFNPFSAHIVKQVLDNLNRAVDTFGRKAFIIYQYPTAPEIFADPNRYRLLSKRRKFWTLEVLPNNNSPATSAPQ